MVEHTNNKPLPRRPHSPASNSPVRPHSRRLSVSSIVQAVFPRRRPEQGGTRREKGYWEAIDGRTEKNREGGRLSANDTGCLSLTPSSDRIVHWNTPKLIPMHRRASSAGGATQSRPPLGATRPLHEESRRRSWTSVSGDFRLVRSSPVVTSGPGLARSKSDQPQRTPTPHPGCPKEEVRQNQARRTLADRIMARRRQRRSLKESGDYLGVQGVNPLTGEPDHITPFSSDERSELSVDKRKGHLRIPRTFTTRSASADEKLVGEVQAKSSRHQANAKDAVDTQKHEKQGDASQWSSAQEPNLSPIEQSSLSGKTSWLHFTCEQGSCVVVRTKLTVFLDVSDRDILGRSITPAEINDSPLIRFGSPVHGYPTKRNPQDSLMETSISFGLESEDASSCETVLRSDRRASSQSPSWAQELYENGIVFAHPVKKTRRGEQNRISRDSFQSTKTPEPQERHITFASPSAIPAIRATSPKTPVHPLPSIYSNVPGFRGAQPPPDPREERCRKAKTSKPGTQERHKEPREVVSDEQCREMNSRTRKRTLASTTPEECPTTKMPLTDQKTSLRKIALLKNRNSRQDGTLQVLAGTFTPNQTLEHVVRDNRRRARDTIIITPGQEIIRRSETSKTQKSKALTIRIEKNSITHIRDLTAVGLKRDRSQRPSESFATPPGLRKEDPLAVGLSQERAMQKDIHRWQPAMDWKVEEDHETRRRGAGEDMRNKSFAYTRTTTTGSDHRRQMDDTSMTGPVARSGHVPGAFDEHHRDILMSSEETSHAPLIPSLSWSSQTPLIDIQEHDTLSIRTPEMVDMGKKSEGDHALTDHGRLSTFMTMFPRQPSTTTWGVTTEEGVRPTDSNNEMRESKQGSLWKRGRPEGEGDEHRAPMPASPREWVALVAGGAMVLSVHAVSLYLRYLRHCLNPQSGLMKKMREGQLTVSESGVVVVTVLVTFHVAFAVYMVFDKFGAAMEWFRVMCEE